MRDVPSVADRLFSSRLPRHRVLENDAVNLSSHRSQFIGIGRRNKLWQLKRHLQDRVIYGVERCPSEFHEKLRRDYKSDLMGKRGAEQLSRASRSRACPQEIEKDVEVHHVEWRVSSLTGSKCQRNQIFCCGSLLLARKQVRTV